MINYDQYGESNGCTHAIEGAEMDLMESAECANVAADAARSLHDYAVRLHEENSRAVDVRRALEAQVNYLLQRNRILASFAEWVYTGTKDGGGIAPHDLAARARRSLAGEERTESRPPRKMEGTQA